MKGSPSLSPSVIFFFSSVSPGNLFRVEREGEQERERGKKRNGSRSRATRIGWTREESEEAAANQAAQTASTGALSNNTATYCMQEKVFAAHQCWHNTSNAMPVTLQNNKVFNHIFFSFIQKCISLSECKQSIGPYVTWLNVWILIQLGQRKLWKYALFSNPGKRHRNFSLPLLFQKTVGDIFRYSLSICIMD